MSLDFTKINRMIILYYNTIQNKTDDKILNLEKKDYFGSEPISIKKDFRASNANYIHIRVQQRTTKKKLTTCEGLSQDLNFREILKILRKKFSCNGCIIEHTKLGKIIQLQGNHAQNIFLFLTQTQICKADDIKIHGML